MPEADRPQGSKAAGSPLYRWLLPGWAPKSILVPLDGSVESERILPWVRAVAQKTGSRVTLLGVIDTEDPTEYQTRVHVRVDPAALARKAAVEAAALHGRERTTTYLNSVASALESTSHVRSAVAFGEAADKICEVAREEAADIIAMASRRESAMVRGVLGSVTSRVLHSHVAPVLVVRVDDRRAGPAETDGPGWPRQIVVPLDASPLSESAVDPAISLARTLKTGLRFLRVTPRFYHPGAGGDIGYVAAPVTFGEQLRKEAFEYLAPFVQRAIDAGVDAFADARSGAAAEQITDALHSPDGSMAMMTSHGRSGFKRWSLGSICDKVIRASGVPVLVMPPSGAD